jgi:membrane protein implicated in regulation of membrane protease activity
MSLGLSLLLIAAGSLISFSFGIRRRAKRCRSPQNHIVPANSIFEPAKKTALVAEPITSTTKGRVRFQGTTWPAKGHEKSFQVGEEVMITGLDNITLFVDKRHHEGSTLDKATNGWRGA